MLLDGILCKCMEYGKVGEKWLKQGDWSSKVNSIEIENMIAGGSYLTRMGGYSGVEYKQNRRFGIVPVKIVVVSICGKLKKVYTFGYESAELSIYNTI